MASTSTLVLKRQLQGTRPICHVMAGRPLIMIAMHDKALRKHPVDGFSAGLVDDDNVYEWEVRALSLLSWAGPGWAALRSLWRRGGRER